MASDSSSSSKRRKLESGSGSADSSSADPPYALLASSPVLLTPGVERELKVALAAAVERVGISLATATSVLSLLAAAQTAVPLPIPIGDAELFFLVPFHPALRVLSVEDAAAAWELGDFLCLGVRQLEEDLVQRYMEDPAAVADWRAAIGTTAHPAREMLWTQLGVLYEKLYDDLPGAKRSIPPLFGEAPSAEMLTEGDAWRRGMLGSTFLMANAFIRRFRPDILARLCTALFLHIADPEYAYSGLASLSRALGCCDYSTAREFQAAGFPPFIFSALEVHETRRDIARLSTQVLCCLACTKLDDGDDTVCMISSGDFVTGAPILLRFLQRHASDLPDAAGLALCVLGSGISMWDTLSVYLDAGAVTSLLATVSQFPDESCYIYNRMVDFISELLAYSETHAQFLAADGPVVLVAILSKVGVDFASTDAVYKALTAAATTPETCAALVAAGCIPNAVNFLASREGAAGVAVLKTDSSCALLQRLVDCDAEHCVAVAAAGAIPALLA